MKSQADYKHALQQVMGQVLGIQGPVMRVWKSQVESALSATTLATLPTTGAFWGTLQDPSGQPFFMADLSQIDGPDPIQ